jgi:hypothetical protein
MTTLEERAALEMNKTQLKQLCKLLAMYAKYIGREQPMAEEVIMLVVRWVKEDIEEID